MAIKKLMLIEELLIWRGYRILDSFVPERYPWKRKQRRIWNLSSFDTEICSFTLSPLFQFFSLKFSVIQFENKRVDLVCVVLGKTLYQKEKKTLIDIFWELSQVTFSS